MMHWKILFFFHLMAGQEAVGGGCFLIMERSRSIDSSKKHKYYILNSFHTILNKRVNRQLILCLPIPKPYEHIVLKLSHLSSFFPKFFLTTTL